jgi:cytochrome P450 family 142 subfamily A polypeptide 1
LPHPTSPGGPGATAGGAAWAPAGCVDLLSEQLYGEVAAEAYAWMRREAPVHHDEVNDLWAIATWDDVSAASRDSATFSNAGGSRPKIPPSPWMIDMDGSDHTRRRMIVSKAFTPARVKATFPAISALCGQLVDLVADRDELDIVADLATPLPMIVIGDMLGVERDDHDLLLRWSDDLIGSIAGTDSRVKAAAEAFAEFDAYARRTIEDRRSRPRDDLISVLVGAEVNGERLTDDELVMESLLILLGGDETTRHVISGGVDLLLRNPGEHARLVANRALLDGAVEEMLRCVSPIKNMARTVTRTVEICGTTLLPGYEAVLLYESANQDDTHFADPLRFDVTRTPNDHLAFGVGAHYCLGAALARVEIKAMVGCILDRLPDLEPAGDAAPERFLGSLRALPVRRTKKSRHA